MTYRATLALLAVALASGPLFAARPVARWDVVPYQRVSGVFKVGVVAFHESSVNVLFKVDGRKKWSAKRPTKNDRTGVEEYVFPFDPVKCRCKPGPVTLSATATSEGGESYDLPDLVLYADPNGDLGSRKVVYVDPVKGNDFADATRDAPVKTLGMGIKKAEDGGTVMLAAGRYRLDKIGIGKRREYWTTVQPAPGVDGSEVKVEGGRPVTDKLRFRDVDIFAKIGPDANLAIYVGEGRHPLFAWFDGCRMYNSEGRGSGRSMPFGNRLMAYVTGGRTSDVTHGPRCELVRNHTVEKITGSAFSGSNALIANCKVSDIDSDGSGVIASVLYEAQIQYPRWVDNVILFNVEADNCKSRGLVGSRLRDSAFVNVKFATAARDEGNLTRFSLGLDNVIFRNVEISGQDWIWVDNEFGLENVEPKDVVMENVKVDNYQGCDVSGFAGIRKK